MKENIGIVLVLMLPVSSERTKKILNMVCLRQKVNLISLFLNFSLGPSYTAVCQAYRNDQGRRELLKDNLEDVSFTDPLGANFQFVDRSGSYGYRYYAVSSGVLGVTTYNEVCHSYTVLTCTKLGC